MRRAYLTICSGPVCIELEVQLAYADRSGFYICAYVIIYYFTCAHTFLYGIGRQKQSGLKDIISFIFCLGNIDTIMICIFMIGSPEVDTSCRLWVDLRALYIVLSYSIREKRTSNFNTKPMDDITIILLLSVIRYDRINALMLVSIVRDSIFNAFMILLYDMYIIICVCRIRHCLLPCLLAFFFFFFFPDLSEYVSIYTYA